MPRPPWQPITAAHHQALAALETAATHATEAETAMWKAAEAARDLDVPLDRIAATIGRGIATVYRHLPARPKAHPAAQDTEPPPRS